MSKIKISKVTSVPAAGAIVANTFYAVSVGDDQMEIYFSASAGTSLRRIPTTADILALIETAVSGISALQVVENINERDALTWEANGKVYVRDASDDGTVDSGGAGYIYDFANSEYIKGGEAESLDMITRWENIQGRPSSTPAQIDTAVGNSHSHNNKTQLDAIGQDADGEITYNGVTVSTVKAVSTAW